MMRPDKHMRDHINRQKVQYFSAFSSVMQAEEIGVFRRYYESER